MTAGYNAVTLTDCNAATIAVDFTYESNSERFTRHANRAADEAMLQGLIGDAVTSGLAAELADAYAEAAIVWSKLEWLLRQGGAA